MNEPKQPTSILERLVKESGFGVFESSNYSESKTNPQLVEEQKKRLKKKLKL